MQPYILMLEDDPIDAQYFLELMQEVAGELGAASAPEPLNDDAAYPDELSRDLARCGVRWVRSVDEFMADDPLQYSLWIMDLRLHHDKSIDSWRILRSYDASVPTGDGGAPIHGAPPVWILSHYTILQHSAEQFLQVQRFYSKTASGYRQLKRDLVSRYGVKRNPTADSIELQLNVEAAKAFVLDDIVAISSELKSGVRSNAHKRAYFLYYLNGPDKELRPYPLHEKYNLKKLLKALQGTGRMEFCLLARDLIVNTHHIIDISRSQREISVTLAGFDPARTVSISESTFRELRDRV